MFIALADASRASQAVFLVHWFYKHFAPDGAIAANPLKAQARSENSLFRLRVLNPLEFPLEVSKSPLHLT